jgi:phosphomannomutase
MSGLRAQPPTSIAGIAVTAYEDLAEGTSGLPPTDGLRFTLESGARVIIRPSGTEPKVKCYLQTVVPVGDGDVAAAKDRAATEIAALSSDVSRWLQ